MRGQFALVAVMLTALSIWVAHMQADAVAGAHPHVDGDAAMHVLNQVGLGLALRDSGLLGLLGWRDSYPPFGFLPPAAAVWGGDPSLEAAARAQWVWVLLAGIAAYGLGRWLRGPAAGAVAALVVVTSPAAVAQLRTTMLDMPLAAMTALSVWALAESDFFSRRRPALAAGAAAGLALWTKWSWAFFGGPAWLAAAAVCLWRGGPRWPPFAALAGALAAAALLTRGVRMPDAGDWQHSVRSAALVWCAWPVLMGAGCLLLRRMRETPSRNLAEAGLLALALGLPFYVLNHDMIAWRLDRHVEDFTIAVNLREAAAGNLEDFSRHTLPALWVLLAFAAARAAWTRDLGRQLPVWAALVGGLAITVAWMPAGPRYLLPAWPIATALAVAGLAGLGRLRHALLAAPALLALWQITLVAEPEQPFAHDPPLAWAGMEYRRREPIPWIEVGGRIAEAPALEGTVWAVSDPASPRPEFLQVESLVRGRGIVWLQIYRNGERQIVAPPLGLEPTRRALPREADRIAPVTALEDAPRPQGIVLLHQDPAFRERAVARLQQVLGTRLRSEAAWDSTVGHAELLVPER